MMRMETLNRSLPLRFAPGTRQGLSGGCSHKTKIAGRRQDDSRTLVKRTIPRVRSGRRDP